jgi:hypothetical protein
MNEEEWIIIIIIILFSNEKEWIYVLFNSITWNNVNWNKQKSKKSHILPCTNQTLQNKTLKYRASLYGDAIKVHQKL